MRDSRKKSATYALETSRTLGVAFLCISVADFSGCCLLRRLSFDHNANFFCLARSRSHFDGQYQHPLLVFGDATGCSGRREGKYTWVGRARAGKITGP